MHGQDEGGIGRLLNIVEQLAEVLKSSGVTDQQVGIYCTRQEALNKSGNDIILFLQILAKAQVVTQRDGGKSLLKALTEYGSLGAAIGALRGEIKGLQKQVYGLEEQAILKGKIALEVSKLKVEKAELVPQLADLKTQYQNLVNTKNAISELGPKKKALEQQVANLVKDIVNLDDQIKLKEEKTTDLHQVEENLATALAELKAKEDLVKKEDKSWQVFQGFLGWFNRRLKKICTSRLRYCSPWQMSCPITRYPKISIS